MQMFRKDTILQSVWGRVYMSFLFGGAVFTAIGAIAIAETPLGKIAPIGRILFGGGVVLASLQGLVVVRAVQWRKDESKLKAINYAGAVVFVSLVLFAGFCWWVFAGQS
jgi:hypothetical protein